MCQQAVWIHQTLHCNKVAVVGVCNLQAYADECARFLPMHPHADGQRRRVQIAMGLLKPFQVGSGAVLSCSAIAVRPRLCRRAGASFACGGQPARPVAPPAPLQANQIASAFFIR